MQSFLKLRASISILALLLMVMAVPVTAQYDQDDAEQAECFIISLNAGNLGGIGQYVFYFFYQDDVFLTVPIQFAESNEVLHFNVVVPPQTEVQVLSPIGGAIGFVLADGTYNFGNFGSASIRIGDMNSECLSQATDGRINRGDTHMLAAIYDDDAGGYDIWSINDELAGNFDYNVSRAQLEAALESANNSGQSQLLGTGITSTFYALPGNQCLLESPTDQGDMQGFIITSCSSLVLDSTQIDPPANVEISEPESENASLVAEEQSGYLVVNTLNASVRSCDQPTCTQIATVHSGDYLLVLGINGESDDRLWWYVQIGGITGWIWGDLVAGRGDLTDVPIMESQGERTQATIYLGFTGNPIYDSLSASGRSICAVQANDNYPLLGRNADTSWVYIQAQCVDGTTVTGWMAAGNVAIRNTGNVFVPILNADGSSN